MITGGTERKYVSGSALVSKRPYIRLPVYAFLDLPYLEMLSEHLDSVQPDLGKVDPSEVSTLRYAAGHTLDDVAGGPSGIR